MNFGQRKLTKEDAGKLRVRPVDSIRPYTVMAAPVYAFLRANEKFLSVKGPLDFFTPEELTRLRRFDNFFLPEFVDSVEPFREAARAVRAIFSTPTPTDGTGPSPFEISDAIIRALGALWSPGLAIEPFFLAMFADELCAPLPADVLKGARDRDVREYERALIISGTTIFLALHLGYCDLTYLNLLRLDVFEKVVSNRPSLMLAAGSELSQVYTLAFELVGEDITRVRTAVARGTFSERPERAAQKLYARLARVEAEFLRTDSPAPSIFGERGFVDA